MTKELKYLADIGPYLSGEREIFLLYDKNVAWVAAEVTDAVGGVKGSIAIDTSEERKTMDTVMSICRSLMQADASRGAFLLSVGGGITTDIGGFAASIYKRGIRYANLPTTLLAQVDAAIGGKTGVNLDDYKNMLGVIVQPQFTFLCPEVLRTLPEREFRAGVAELLKTFLLADATAYKYAVRLLSGRKNAQNLPKGTENNCSGRKMAENLPEGAENNSLGRKMTENLPELQSLIGRAAEIKAGIVGGDPYEHGERALLNLGHTFGHAIEHEARQRGEDIVHGEAVAIGIILAAEMSDREGLSNALAPRLRADFRAVGLPVECPYPLETLREAMTRDKKAGGGKLRFVLLKDIGLPVIVEREPIDN